MIKAVSQWLWRLTLAPALIPALITASALPGCAVPPQYDHTAQAIEKTLEDAARESEAQARAKDQPPREVLDALLPPLDAGSLRGAGGEPRFDIAVNNLDAQEFFLSLVEGSAYNAVVHPEVTGAISLSLKGVTIPQVMDSVRDVYGYDFQRTGATFRILPATLQTRLFKVDYLRVNRIGQSQTRISSGQISEKVGTTTAGGTTTATTTSAAGAGVTANEVKTESKSDFWTELETALKALVTGEGRSVVVSQQSGVVVVRALPSELRNVELFLNSTQTSVERQVILEAKILEVELNDGFQSGINWNAALFEPRGSNKTVTVGQTGGSRTIAGGAGSSVLAATTGVATGLLSPFPPFAIANGIFSLTLALNDFNVFIDLLKQQGDVHVLSSPRVSTVNNQKALIKVGSDEFFVTNATSTTTTVTGATTVTPSITLTPFFSGIALEVIPQISENGEVILYIHPTVSEVEEQTKTITTSSGTTETKQTFPLAKSTVRESDSIVRAADNQVVVIGGLMQDRARNEKAGVPGAEGPVLDNLLGHKRASSRKSELVILLRPTVVKDEHQWTDSLRTTAESFKSIKRVTQ
ncbi:MAG: secretin N-terminal domain-containing protein [Gammaproteobacteria bacterium]|nr:secretin N-terminal domain-containing protein [Gammaproteobacteria bacterium]